MYKEFEVKVIVPSSLVPGFYTMYLFNFEHKILLPIEINRWSGESLILAKSRKPSSRPHIHNTLKRVINSFGAQVRNVLIYNHEDGIFYAYVRIVTKGGNILDIDSKVTDAICLGLRCNVSILVRHSVYNSEGIRVTKDLIEKSINTGIG